MSKTRNLISASLFAVAAAFASAPAQSADIVTVASEAGTFNTLLAAAQAAGMADFFAGGASAPMTLFAPTDEAFAALGQDAIDALLADPEALREVLMYHVVLREIPSSALRNREVHSLYMMNFGHLNVWTTQSGVRLGDIGGSARVVTADIEADNGVIHVIDQVLMP
ncbi:MAG: fasciclin domain-containing protein [Azospirillaceae bacterium]